MDRCCRGKSLNLLLQTEIADSLLEPKLARRAVMQLREQYPGTKFFAAVSILGGARIQREEAQNSHVVRFWKFFTKYVTGSPALDWSTEPCRPATTREIKQATR